MMICEEGIIIRPIADVHCHILPGVDDGAQTIEEACQMLKIAYEEGIRIIVMTPHHHPRRGMADITELKKKMRVVRDKIPEIGEDLRIFLGMEVFFREDILDEIEAGKIKLLGKSGYILVEFSPSDDFAYIRNGLQKVQMKGCKVILAHIERYQCMLEDIHYAEELIDMGVYIQVNSGSITGDSGREVKKYVKELMKNRFVHLVGTDAHSTERRRPKMKKAMSYVQKRFGNEYAEQIFLRNTVAVLKDQDLEV